MVEEQQWDRGGQRDSEGIFPSQIPCTNGMDFRFPVFSQLLFSSAASSLTTSVHGLTQGRCLRWTELGIVYAAGPCWPEIGQAACELGQVCGQSGTPTHQGVVPVAEGRKLL